MHKILYCLVILLFFLSCTEKITMVNIKKIDHSSTEQKNENHKINFLNRIALF